MGDEQDGTKGREGVGRDGKGKGDMGSGRGREEGGKIVGKGKGGVDLDICRGAPSF